MRIAQVSPIFERVPPLRYGGTERVVSYLTEELVAQGHDVTLFASGDSVTRARLVAASAQSVRPQIGQDDWLAYHIMQMDMVREMAVAGHFDIIHFHTNYLHFALAESLRTPSVTTLHGRLDLPEMQPLFQRFRHTPVVSISDNQRLPLPHAHWCGTIHHGLPPDLYQQQVQAGRHFLFVGRISPEKRVDRAIDIAQRCGVRLVICAKIDRIDQPYFDTCIKPLLGDPLIEFIGEVGEPEKRNLLESARALLFPIDWPEPFGLVMIEAFCCGTPVIAYGHGSVPEVMEDGVTGFVVSNQEEAVRAARNIDAIDRRACRAAFERRFTVARMARAYAGVYAELMQAPHKGEGDGG